MNIQQIFQNDAKENPGLSLAREIVKMASQKEKIDFLVGILMNITVKATEDELLTLMDELTKLALKIKRRVAWTVCDECGKEIALIDTMLDEVNICPDCNKGTLVPKDQ